LLNETKRKEEKRNRVVENGKCTIKKSFFFVIIKKKVFRIKKQAAENKHYG